MSTGKRLTKTLTSEYIDTRIKHNKSPKKIKKIKKHKLYDD